MSQYDFWCYKLLNSKTFKVVQIALRHIEKHEKNSLQGVQFININIIPWD